MHQNGWKRILIISDLKISGTAYLLVMADFVFEAQLGRIGYALLFIGLILGGVVIQKNYSKMKPNF